MTEASQEANSSQPESPKDLESLPGERAGDRLSRTLEMLPDDLKGWRGLLARAGDHLQVALGDKRSVAIVGPANAGKSTFYNQLVREPSEKAEVSAVPGTTRQAQSADAGLFDLVDTPGADAVGAVGEAEKLRAIEAASSADVLVVLFDATHGIRGPEQRLYAELTVLELPLVVALNKIDLIPKYERESIRKQAAGALSLSPEQVILLSAKYGAGTERVLQAIAEAEPGIIAALGATLPAHRWKLAQIVIGRSATTAAAIAMTPLPIVDFLPLLGIQAAMVLGIARIYKYRLSLARARELIAAFGIGVLGRTLFYELTRLGGPPGWVVAAAVAVGTTTALGYASAVWFDRGERLSGDALRSISKAITESVMDRLKSLGRRRPDRKSLRERVSEALDDLPLPDETMKS